MPSSKLDIAKKQHRERSQPANRKKLGLLEKHSDYVKRAKDYHSKQNRLDVLKSRAASRNKDEFYFGMQSNKTKKGVHIQSRGNKALPTDFVKLLKSQDVKYIQNKRKSEQKRIAHLEEQLHVAGQDLDEQPEAGPSKRAKAKHTVFVESLDDLASYRSQTTTKSNPQIGTASSNLAEMKSELSQRRARDRTLARTERDLHVQKLLMSKGSRKEIVRKRMTDMEKEYDDDDDDTKAMRKGLHKPEAGLSSGARVWKWRAVRK